MSSSDSVEVEETIDLEALKGSEKVEKAAVEGGINEGHIAGPVVTAPLAEHQKMDEDEETPPKDEEEDEEDVEKENAHVEGEDKMQDGEHPDADEIEKPEGQHGAYVEGEEKMEGGDGPAHVEGNPAIGKAEQASDNDCGCKGRLDQLEGQFKTQKAEYDASIKSFTESMKESMAEMKTDVIKSMTENLATFTKRFETEPIVVTTESTKPVIPTTPVIQKVAKKTKKVIKINTPRPPVQKSQLQRPETLDNPEDVYKAPIPLAEFEKMKKTMTFDEQLDYLNFREREAKKNLRS